MSSEMQKLGLALSGGGFRASFFHIGVMARLAELDLLRSVEVLSCVSGGSIIGALYYLHLKRLLESKSDSEILQQDYLDIIKKIEVDFLEGVQTNVRVRAFSNFAKNWKMLMPSYSRSDRMAELYDETFYNDVADHPTISLSEIKIQPHDGPEGFHPRKHNATRRAKVPMLIINATTLNTGRNWQFTAVDMGERETDAETQAFEKNLILTPLRFSDATLPDEKYRRVPLSVAVAASACVPGIFPPLALTDLYQDFLPQLVDGGVYDNQGLASIIYEECSDVIVSDGSGQLLDVNMPGSGAVTVLDRTNAVLMEKVRNQGLHSLYLYQKGGTINGSSIMHLREEIALQHLKPGEKRLDADAADTGTTSYGIDKHVQRCLAETRTDLDSFTDIEAYSLMYSGYRISNKMIGETFPAHAGAARDISNLFQHPTTAWTFLSARTYAERGTVSGYVKELSNSSKTLFKAYFVAPKFIPLGVLIVLVSLIVPLIPLVVSWRLIAEVFSLSFWWVVGILAVMMMPALLHLGSVKNIRANNILNYVLIGSGALFGTLLSFLHLKIIDPLFVKRGTFSALSKSSSSPTT